MALTKPKSSKSPVANYSVEEYLQSRVDKANSEGYSITKVWLKKTNLPEATDILREASIKYEQVNEEPDSVQLQLKW